MSMGTAAFAASITITRDSSYQTGDSGNGNVYKYYKVFSASYTSNTSTGGGSTDGAPGDVTASATNAAYTATAEVAAKLGSWVPATGTPGQDGYVAAHWEKATGNLWFDLTPIAGSDPQTYSVTWINSSDDADTVQAAAAWLIEKGAYEDGPTTLSFADGQWTSGNIDAGYYLIEGATGKNLVAATSDININEKNTYPPQDKTQKDEDADDYGDEAVDVAVGDVINYKVTVTIPATAKVGDQILVWDKASTGLSYVDNSVTVSENTGNATVADPTSGVDSSWTWSKLITVTDGSQGKDVVFSFDMTVTSDALVDTDKENESGIKYGRDGSWNYESKPDEVEFKTYFAGIHKIDGDTDADLEGVEFTLKEAGNEFTVKKDGDYYIPATGEGASSTVVTDSQGRIMIRGLDKDKTYTLTETKTLDGYNMLASDVTLSLYEDTITKTDTEGTTTTTTSFDPTKTNEKWGEVENNKGAVLPSTGGIGTTIFYVVGSIMVVAAGVLLITKKRMSREG